MEKVLSKNSLLSDLERKFDLLSLSPLLKLPNERVYTFFSFLSKLKLPNRL